MLKCKQLNNWENYNIPGPYVLEKREERVSDILKRAGGFTPEAYKEGAFIKRYNTTQ